MRAVALQQTTKDLQNGLNQMDLKAIADSQEKERSGSKEKLARVAGYTFSIVILRALATEYALKALSFKKTGQYRKDLKGHDLLVLFNDLDFSTKEIIKDLEESHGVAPLQKILGKHRSDFLEWRYPAEGKELRTSFLDLEKALDILIIVYGHRKFHQLSSSDPQQ